MRKNSNKETNYQIVRQIGKGGFSRVYLLKDQTLGIYRALKIVSVRPDPESQPAESSRQTDTVRLRSGKPFRAEVHREVSLQMRLVHPSIPRILSMEDDEEEVRILMEHVFGRPVSDLPGLPSGLTPRIALSIGIRAAHILNDLHSRPRPVIYGDLKPAHLILSEDQSLHLIDFGAALEVSGSQAYAYGKSTRKKNKIPFAGSRIPPSQATPAFLAPELADPEGILTIRADVYAFGRLMYILLTGRFPGQGRLQNRLALMGKCRMGLRRMILCCMQADPHMRYPDLCRPIRQMEGYERQIKRAEEFRPFTVIFRTLLLVVFVVVLLYLMGQDANQIIH